MLLTFFLGLTGSLGHCAGMCGGLVFLCAQRGTGLGWRLMLVHLGRITTYGLLGLAAGAAGQTMTHIVPGLRQFQGVLSLAAGGIAVYLAASLMGWVPSPEARFRGLTRLWGRAMRHLMERRRPLTADRYAARSPSLAAGSRWSAASVFALGLLWGLLPCGLVLTALFTAAVTGSPWRGALGMMAFGLGTLPALLGVGWLSRRGIPKALPWPRQAAAVVVLLFGTQMALRGLAAWGWVSHVHVGGLMLW